jgi:hypothetical protein
LAWLAAGDDEEFDRMEKATRKFRHDLTLAILDSLATK